MHCLAREVRINGARLLIYMMTLILEGAENSDAKGKHILVLFVQRICFQRVL